METISTTMTSRLALSSDTYAIYAAQAAQKSEREKSNQSPEDLMSARLTQFASIDCSKPIILSDVDRQMLEQLLGRNFDDAATLTDSLHHALSISIDGLVITLPPRLLDRLRSRSLGMDFDKFLSMLVKRSLEEFVGMR